MRTSELTGAALDWAVAKCEGYEIVRMRGSEITFLDRTDDGALNEKQIGYSTDWAQGGPIIERERLWVGYSALGQSLKLVVMADAVVECRKSATPPNCSTTGPTILIAAMRCYVTSKLGDEVEIPTELTQDDSAAIAPNQSQRKATNEL